MRETARCFLLWSVILLGSYFGPAGVPGALPSGDAPSAPAALPTPAAGDSQAPACDLPPHENLNAVLWVQTSAEYRATALQSYNIARQQLAVAIDDTKWSALTEKPDGPFPDKQAIILDLDETVLDNSPHQAFLTRNQLNYSPSIWSQWVNSRAATALPGSLALVKDALQRNVAVFFVTNRNVSDKPATVENLQAIGFEICDLENHVLCSGQSDPDTSEKWTDDKTKRREYIGRKYRVLLLIGDQLGDFVADPMDIARRAAVAEKYADYWGRKWICLANPMYGSYEQLLSGKSGIRSVAIDRKYQSLRVWLPSQ